MAVNYVINNLKLKSNQNWKLTFLRIGFGQETLEEHIKIISRSPLLCNFSAIFCLINLKKKRNNQAQQTDEKPLSARIL